ncbi:hypothetical protein GAY29_05610 [Azospirillum brasilense]|nr:hypothetical protein [Azospirillum brasilense]
MALGVPLSMGLFSNLVLAVSASRGRTLTWRVGTRSAVGQGHRHSQTIHEKSPHPSGRGLSWLGTPRRPQTWKLSPQPQRPFSFGFLKTNPVWNLSST